TTASTTSFVGNYPVTVSNFTQTGSNFSSRSTQNGYMAVTPLAANLSITAPSRGYDGTTTIAGSLVTSASAISNKVGSDDVAISGSGAFTDKNVGAGNKNFDFTGLTLTGTTAGNYYLASNTRSGTTGTVTAKSVNWLVDNASSIYGTTATVGAAHLAGAISGDDVAATVVVYQTGTSTVVTPAARTAVGSYDEKVTALSGADNGNYTLAGTGNTTGILSITPKAITLTSNAITKTYDGATTYSVQAGDLTAIAGASEIVSGDALTAITLAYADKNAGTSKRVLASGATIGDGAAGNASGNYTISYVDAATGAVTAKSISVGSAPTAANKVYDGRTDAALSGGAFTGGGVVGGDTVNLFSTGAFVDKDVANTKTVNLTYVLNGISASNYSLASSSGTTTANITTAPLIMTANDAAKVFADTDPTLGARYSGFVNGETASVLSSVSVTRAAGETANTTYAITPSASSTNYAITPVNGIFTVSPVDTLLIQVADPASKVYGDALTSFIATSAKYYNTANTAVRTLTLTNTAGNSYTYDDGLGTTGGFDLSTTATAASSVGNYAVTVS
ncbi:MAG: YDG domain-containing protein, partial [Verrucomicrobiota bacterium]